MHMNLVNLIIMALYYTSLNIQYNFILHCMGNYTVVWMGIMYKT